MALEKEEEVCIFCTGRGNKPSKSFKSTVAKAMADSRRGGRTWWRALNTEFTEDPTIYPSEIERGCGPGSWICCHEKTLVTPGVGRSPEEAYVDYVEEFWCRMGQFPKGYPL